MFATGVVKEFLISIGGNILHNYIMFAPLLKAVSFSLRSLVPHQVGKGIYREESIYRATQKQASRFPTRGIFNEPKMASESHR